MSMDLVISGTNRAEIIPIEWLEVETHKGNLVIQEGHAPAYIVLKKSSFVQWSLETGVLEKMKIERAFLKVDRKKCLLIIDNE